MSALEVTAEHLSMARVNGEVVPVHQAHRIAGQRYGPVLVTVAAPVALTLEEVAALLFFYWESQGVMVGELAEDEFVRQLVAEEILAHGCLRVEEAMATAEDTGREPTLEYCSERAEAVFAPTALRWAGEVSR